MQSGEFRPWYGCVGLTERVESVVFLLFGLMGVSLGTVQTHVKAVYRKAGVHSKQELIEYIEREVIDRQE